MYGELVGSINGYCMNVIDDKRMSLINSELHDFDVKLRKEYPNLELKRITNKELNMVLAQSTTNYKRYCNMCKLAYLEPMKIVDFILQSK